MVEKPESSTLWPYAKQGTDDGKGGVPGLCRFLFLGAGKPGILWSPSWPDASSQRFIPGSYS